MRLATAYLNIQRQRHDRQLAFDIAIVGDAHDARMPPMLLLPLIDYAVRAAQRRRATTARCACA